jgi:lipoprotein NlpD
MTALRLRNGLVGCCSAVVVAVLAACSTTHYKAPVEDRSSTARSSVRGVGTAPSGTETPAGGEAGPGGEVKPGTYVVKPGDTLIRIGLDTGQSWRDLARWNNIDNPNVIEVGTVLQVVPPPGEVQPVIARPVVPSRLEARPIDSKPVASAATTPPVAGASGTSVAAASAASASTAVPREGDDNIQWVWPAAGPIGAMFDEAKNKGVDILGKSGDPVVAAADGRVVYVGSGVRGYGNLLIIKHNASYITAYAHNKAILVKEDQVVRKGQKVAEMGSTDSDKVELHFEIRNLGKPVDPLKILPAH